MFERHAIADHVVVCFIEAWNGAASGEFDCAIASWQGILDEATASDHDDSIINHAEGFNLWLCRIHRQNRPVAHEKDIGHASILLSAVVRSTLPGRVPGVS